MIPSKIFHGSQKYGSSSKFGKNIPCPIILRAASAMYMLTKTTSYVSKRFEGRVLRGSSAAMKMLFVMITMRIILLNISDVTII
jgi:hypothetical protein